MAATMLFVVLALAALLPLCLSQCLPADLVAHQMFIDSDSDADGVLHLLELVDVFHVYDANNDGRISRHEYTTYQTQHDPTIHDMAHALYDVYDFNQDHHLEMDDYVQFYRSMDSDGDDSVSEIEFKTHWIELFNNVKHHGDHIC